ncbi:MAG TPA: tetratricopeptide repeat protein [Pirellulaceae bacterium]|nr:tetratricopeptide repeat protein [Pirellulaceae bacterium]HMO92448.1 tetratricopeptide repeat protein [Pirellulaceae bacterium]HMP67882.1 tetratricopeptide repeat protein [Pirellulaceae bacterium]
MFKRRKSYEFRQSRFSFSRLFGPLVRVFSKSERGLAQEAKSRRGIGQILLLPFHFFWMIVVFLISNWATSRSGRAFVFGFPALITATGVVAGILIFNHFHRNIVLNRYEMQINRMMREREPQLAITLANRLINSVPDQPRYKYLLALAKLGRGNNSPEVNDTDEAISIMRLLATFDKDGFADAHQWIAGHYLEAQTPEVRAIPETERLEKSKEHLEFALQITDRDNLQAVLQLAVVNERLGRINEAIQGYRFLVDYDFSRRDMFDDQILAMSSAGPPLLKLMFERGDNPATILRYRDRVIERVKAVLGNNPSNVLGWQLIVQCYHATKDYSSALETIEKAYATANTEQVRSQLRFLLSGLYYELASDLKDREEIDFELRLIPISKAIELNPANVAAIREFIEMALDLDNEKINDLLFTTKLSHVVNQITLFARSTLSGDLDKAKVYFKLAKEIDPQATRSIVSSIAVTLCSQQVMRQADGHVLLDAAAEAWPENYLFLITRGEMLIHEERYEDAIKQFQLALEHMPDFVNLHYALSICYEELGDKEKAAHHVNEIERIRAVAVLPATAQGSGKK